MQLFLTEIEKNDDNKSKLNKPKGLNVANNVKIL